MRSKAVSVGTMLISSVQGTPVGALAGSPVPVLDPHGDGAAHGQSVAHPGEDVGAVALDLHAAAASVAHLPAGQVAGDVLLAQRKARGHSLYDNGEPLAVGLTGGQKAEYQVVNSVSS